MHLCGLSVMAVIDQAVGMLLLLTMTTLDKNRLLLVKNTCPPQPSLQLCVDGFARHCFLLTVVVCCAAIVDMPWRL